MSGRPLAVVILLASMAGFGFSAVSTYDSTAHLDRQVHGIHCSYFLGMGKADEAGASGCYTTLMSPYSSVFRQSIWGGIPVALPGMSVFAFLIFWTLWMMVRGKIEDPRAAGFLVAATGLPFLTSIIMGYISIATLDTVCKMCMGIYISSTVAFIAACLIFYQAMKSENATFVDPERPAHQTAPLVSWGMLISAFGIGVAFVVLPVITYAASAPDFSHYAGSCGVLTGVRESERVQIPIGPQNREAEMVEVMDPLCAACGQFEKRFNEMEEAELLNRKIVLFPLDKTCNWMVEESIHPGACVVSEAVLCAGDRAEEVLGWAIENQKSLLETATRQPTAVVGMVTAEFPLLSGCIGGAPVRARLNLALRWIVKNQLQVLTPQVFVQGQRLCDEDTDLGLEYALRRLIDHAKTNPLAASSLSAAPDLVAPLPRPPARERVPTPKGVGKKATAPSTEGAIGPTEASPVTPEPAAPAAPAPAAATPSAAGSAEEEALKPSEKVETAEGVTP